jgi:beta-lactamase regulating signal transducer with metallopeptidase domain
MIDFTGRLGNDALEIWLGLLANATFWGVIAIGVAYLVCLFGRKWLAPGVKAWIWRIAMLKVILCLVPMTPWSLEVLPPQPTSSTVPLTPTEGEVFKSVPLQPSPSKLAPDLTPALIPLGTPSPSYNWALLLIGVWALGAGISTLHVLRGWVWTQRLRRSSELRDKRIGSLLEEVCERLQVRSKPGLALSSVAGPLLLGVVRPLIVLPNGSHAQWSPSELRLVLAHEVAHHKRCDLGWNFLMVMAGVLLWFHPLMWLAHREWRSSSEQACDELTLRATEAQPASYGALLVQLASGGNPSHSLLNVGVADDFHLLKGRLMQFRNMVSVSRRTRLVGTVVLGIGACSLLPVRLVAQEQPNPKVEAAENTYVDDTFAARVVDAKGAPVADAKVYFIDGRGALATTSTDAKGAFVLKNAALTFEPEYDMKMLVVDAGLQGMAKRWVGRPGKVQPLVLEAPFSASFRFVDPDGKPLKNINVLLRQQNGLTKTNDGPWVWFPASILERYTGKTNEEGIVTFQGLPQYYLPSLARLTAGDQVLSAEETAMLQATQSGTISVSKYLEAMKTATARTDLISANDIAWYAPISADDYSKPNSPTITKTIRTGRRQHVREAFASQPQALVVMGAGASGKVLNPDGSAATDVRLMIDGTAAFTFTDQEGKFRFPAAPIGKFVIGVTRKSTPQAFIGHLETTERSDLVVQIKAPRAVKTPPRLDPDH